MSAIRLLKGIAASSALLICCGTLVSCSHLLFFPLKKHIVDPAQHGVTVQDVYFPNTDGDLLHGWLLPAQSQIKATILFLHGNGENISTYVGAVYWLPKYGYQVFIIDYRGYGKSQGKISLTGAIQDIGSAIDYTVDNILNDEPFVVLAQSLGASMAVYAVATSANKAKMRALVLVSPFSDYREITREVLSRQWFTWLFQWPLSYTINNDFSPLRFIQDISPLPLVILHGRDDEIIPIHHARVLMEHAREPKKFVPLKGHHNDLLAIEENKQTLLRFLDSAVSVQ